MYFNQISSIPVHKRDSVEPLSPALSLLNLNHKKLQKDYQSSNSNVKRSYKNSRNVNNSNLVTKIETS